MKTYVKAIWARDPLTFGGGEHFMILNIGDSFDTLSTEIGDVFQIEIIEMEPNEVEKLPEFEGF